LIFSSKSFSFFLIHLTYTAVFYVHQFTRSFVFVVIIDDRVEKRCRSLFACLPVVLQIRYSPSTMIGRTSAITRRATLTSAGLGIGHPSPSLAPSRRTMMSFSDTNNNQDWKCSSRVETSDRFNPKNSSVYRSSHQRAVQPQQKYAFVPKSSFSSTAKDEEKGSGGIRGWMNDRQARQEQEKYIEQMMKLSTMEVFTMELYREELQSGVDSAGMMTKISFMQTKEIKQAKEVVEVVDKIIEVVGPDATAEDLITLDRMQRLRVANAANKTLEEIAIMVSQITNMDVMQKTLRKRYLEGKPIPLDKDAMQAVIQKDAMSVLSKSQKEMMKSRQEQNARRMARRRR
jgi:hypothetical protein